MEMKHRSCRTLKNNCEVDMIFFLFKIFFPLSVCTTPFILIRTLLGVLGIVPNWLLLDELHNNRPTLVQRT